MFALNSWRLDYRSLSAFRIVLGLLLLYDSINRGGYSTLFYSDFGLVPRSLVEFRPWELSLLNLDGSILYSRLFFVAYFLAALLFLLGFNSKLYAFLCFVFLGSVNNRNDLVTNSGDVAFLIFTFWAIFLPLDYCFSFSNKIKKPVYKTYYSIASLGLAIQISLIYFFAVLQRFDAAWLVDGTAVSFALANKPLSSSLRKWFGSFNGFNHILTFLVLFLEFLGAFLLLIPHTFIRTIGVVVLFILQFGIGMSLNLILFPFAMTVCLVPFIPKCFWSTLGFDSTFPKDNLKSQKSYFSQFKIVSLSIFLIAISVLVFWDNLYLIGYVNKGSSAHRYINYLQLRQPWKLYAPRPGKQYKWNIVIAHLNNGEKVELVRNTLPPFFREPKSFNSQFKDGRIRKFYHRLSLPKYKKLRRNFARVNCKKNNDIRYVTWHIAEVKINEKFEGLSPHFTFLERYDC